MGYPPTISRAERAALRKYLPRGSDARHLAAGGVRYVEQPDRLPFLLDTVTGLPFIVWEGRIVVAVTRLLGHEHDVIDARYYRSRLVGNAPGQGGVIATPLMTGGSIDRFVGAYTIEDLSYLGTPIVDFHASSTAECTAILSHIHDTLSIGPYYKRIWLRGQRREYTLERSKIVCEALGYGTDGERQPSLLPSLGRYAVEHPSQIDWGWVVFGPNHLWKKPFLIWVIRQNPQWLRHYPVFMERIEASLRTDDDEEFARILGDIQFDPRVPTEVDDLRQWFFAFYKFSIWILVLQQYGYLASMLDLTWDLDTAVFFTHARIIDGAFALDAPSPGRCIYVFVESKRSPSFWDACDISWGDEDWNRDLPARIAAQRCGALTGSTRERQNLYGNLVVARIYLHGSDFVSTRQPADLFPCEEDDLLYKTLRESSPRPEGLY